MKVGLRHEIKSKIANMPSQAFLVSVRLNTKRTFAFWLTLLLRRKRKRGRMILEVHHAKELPPQTETMIG